MRVHNFRPGPGGCGLFFSSDKPWYSVWPGIAAFASMLVERHHRHLPVSPPGLDAGNELRRVMMKPRMKFCKQAGQSTVEFALTIIIVMVVLFGAIEITIMIYT